MSSTINQRDMVTLPLNNDNVMIEVENLDAIVGFRSLKSSYTNLFRCLDFTPEETTFTTDDEIIFLKKPGFGLMEPSKISYTNFKVLNSFNADEATHATSADSATNATNAGNATTANLATRANTADILDTSAETLGVPHVRIEENYLQFNGSGGGIGEININDTLGKVLFDSQTFFRSSFSTPQFSDTRAIDETAGENCNVPKTFIMGSYLGVIYYRSTTTYLYQSFWNGATWSTPSQVAAVAAPYGASVESPNYLWTAYVRNSDGYILVSNATKSTTPSYSFSALNSYACSYIDMVYHNSEIYIFYKKNSDNKLYYKKISEGGAWSAETLCSNTNTYWKSCVSYGGNLYVFFLGADSKVYYAKWNGSSWTETVLDNVRTFGSYTVCATVYNSKIYIACVSDTVPNTRPVWWSFNGTTVTDENIGAGTAVQPFYMDCETYNNELFFIHQHSSSTSLTGWLYSQKLVAGQSYPSFLGIGIESSGSNNYGMWWKLGNGLVLQIAVTPDVVQTYSANGGIASTPAITVNLPYPFKSPNYFHWDNVILRNTSGGWAMQTALANQTKTSYTIYASYGTTGNRNTSVVGLIIGYDE